MHVERIPFATEAEADLLGVALLLLLGGQVGVHVFGHGVCGRLVAVLVVVQRSGGGAGRVLFAVTACFQMCLTDRCF